MVATERRETMTYLLRACVGAALVALFAGCAPGQGRITRTPEVITEEEVAASEARTAYELVERLRPLWLRSRGERSLRLPTEIVVYQGDTMLGDIETLHGIPIEVVHSVRSLDSAEAGRLAGLGSRHVERVIMVVMRP